MELGVDRLAIVGPGYGGYVAQRYAMRYPDHVEKLLLLSPVDAAGLDPLYGDSMAAVRRILPALCRTGCGSFTSDVLGGHRAPRRTAGSRAARRAIVGRTGHRRAASLTRQELLFTLLGGDDNFVLARVPGRGGVRAARRSRTAPAPEAACGRAQEGSTSPPREPRHPRGDALQEVRFPWSWHATPAERDAAAFSTETAMDRSLAAPFDPGTLVRSDLMRLCRRWPTASPSPPPDPGPMPDVPVLVLAGPERIGFSLETARRTAARFRDGKVLETPDQPSFFGFGHSRCAVSAGLRFLVGQRVQGRCRRAPAVVSPATPAPESVSDLRAVRGVPGRRGRLLQAFGVTFGDLVDSFYVDAFLNIGRSNFDTGLRAGGLRGGNFAITGRAFRLNRYEYVPGVRLSGRWGLDSNRIGPLRIDGPGSLDGLIRISEEDDLTARVRGRVAGRRVHATVRIPSRFADLFGAREDVDSGGSRAAALGGFPR